MAVKELGTPRRYARSVFINCPYDEAFADLFLAYVVGICSFGFTPRSTLEIEGGEQRLLRMSQLIRSCHFSFHDLSRVEIDLVEPRTPRFNMAFETGLAVMCALSNTAILEHKYFVFEADERRLRKSLSDLGGSDIYVHEATVHGVLARIGDALLHAKRRPSVDDMLATWRTVKKGIPRLLADAGSPSLFMPRVYRDLVVLTSLLVK